MVFKLEITKDKFTNWTSLLRVLQSDCEFTDLCNRIKITTETNQYSAGETCDVTVQLFLDRRYLKRLIVASKISYAISALIAGGIWLLYGCNDQVFAETKAAFDEQQLVKAIKDPDNTPCEVVQLQAQTVKRLHKAIARILHGRSTKTKSQRHTNTD